jgi:mRNA-degrading endonuclease RelE of RelBE toxin-antitoxin system
MRFEIVLSPGAAKAMRALRPGVRSGVRGTIELRLRYEPTKVSKSRIKRLRGLDQPQYRLRVGEIRVFYDVSEKTVEILAVVSKNEAEAWLAQEAVPTKARGAGEGQG